MGVLVITCPATGKEFSTGIQIDERETAGLPDHETSTLCPYCKRLHRWWPKEARWVEALPPRIGSRTNKIQTASRLSQAVF
jgi:hypothetical protein